MKTVYVKPTTGDSQNSRVHTFHGCLTKRKYTHENRLHTFHNSYYFLVQLLAEWFHPLPREKIPLCFIKLPLLLRNNTKHQKSVLWGNAKEYERPLHTLYISCIFVLQMCFMAFVQAICSCLKRWNKVHFARVWKTKCDFPNTTIFIIEHYFHSHSYVSVREAFQNDFSDVTVLVYCTILWLMKKFCEMGCVENKPHKWAWNLTSLENMQFQNVFYNVIKHAK